MEWGRHPSEAVTSVLDQRVHELLLGRDTVRLTIAHPDMPAPDVETFRIWCGRVKKENVEELDLGVIFEFLDECVADGREMPDIQKIWIMALDHYCPTEFLIKAAWNLSV